MSITAHLQLPIRVGWRQIMRNLSKINLFGIFRIPNENLYFVSSTGDVTGIGATSGFAQGDKDLIRARQGHREGFGRADAGLHARLGDGGAGDERI